MMKLRVLCLGIVLSIVAGTASAQTFSWRGTSAVSTVTWSLWDNWADGAPPAADQTGTVIIPVGTPANSYNLLLDRDQIIRGEFRYDNQNSTFDLGGYTFTIDGIYREATTTRRAHTWTNGTLVLGILDGEGLDIQVYLNAASDGPREFRYRDMIVDFQNVNQLRAFDVNGNTTTSGTMDFSEATFKNGTFAVHNDVVVGRYQHGQNENNRGAEGTLLLPGSATNLTMGSLLVGIGFGNNHNAWPRHGRGTVDLGGGAHAAMTVSTNLSLGHGANAFGAITNMPNTIDLKIGGDTTRGVGYIGYKDRVQGTNANLASYGYIVAPGGSLEAYFTDLRIGQNTSNTGDAEIDGSAYGIFDFGESVLSVLDITGDLAVGKGNAAVGVLRLAGGEAKAGSVSVGDSNAAENSVLALNGTRMEVLDSLYIGDRGRVFITVGATPAGFDIVSDDELDFVIELDGVIDVDFSAFPGFVWGIRMAGDHQSMFTGYVDGGQLTASGDYAALAQVVYDDNYTYYAVIPEPGTAGLLLLGGATLLLGLTRRR